MNNALRQYEQLAASNPNDEKIPREIAIVSQTIGKTYFAAAQGNKTENLYKALEWNEKALICFCSRKRSKKIR